MSGRKLGLTLCVSLLFASSVLAVPFNVTLNKPATLTGLFGVSAPGFGLGEKPGRPGRIDR